VQGLDRDLAVDSGREAADVDRVALALLRDGMALPGVVRVGLALSCGAGRELAFTASDRDNDPDVDWCRIDGMADVPLTQAVRTAAAIHLPDVVALHERYPLIAPRQVTLGTRALAAYPLVDSGAVHGGVLLSFDAAQPFDGRQRATLQALAERTAAALTDAHERSRLVALAGHGRGPARLPSPDGVCLGQHHGLTGASGAGTRAGGDAGTGWVDAVEMPDGRVLLAAGHLPDGDPASADVARGVLRDAVAAGHHDPVAVIGALDDVLALEPRSDESTFSRAPATCVAILDPGRRRLCVAARGGLPLAVGGAGRPAWSLPAASIRAANGAEAVDLLLPAGSVVALLSDPAVPSAALADAVDRLAPDAPDPLHLALLLGQDVAVGAGGSAWSVLTARLATEPASHRLELDLPDDLTAPRLARRAVTAQLDCWGAGDLADAAEACVSELCTNALMHSATGARLVLGLDPRRLVVLVQNGGTGDLRRTAPEDDGVGGRGLLLVEALCTRWDWQVGAEGTTVWFELHRAAEEGAQDRPVDGGADGVADGAADAGGIRFG
jgi:hypothetical protein